MKNLLAGIVALTLCVILTGSVLTPVIQDYQITVGDEVTYYNGGDDPLLMDYYDDDFTMTYDGSDTVAIDDHSVVRSSTYDYRVMYWEYGRIFMNHGASSIAIYDYRTSTTATVINYAATINYDASENTLTVIKDSDSSTVSTITADTVMAIKEDGNYTYLLSTTIYNAYYNLESVENGTLGYLDAITTYGDYTLDVIVNKSGVTVYGLPDGTEYVATVDVSGGEIVDGTTDVYYHGSPVVTITIGDDVLTVDSFTYGKVILYEISGHESSGAAYALYGVIPLLVICGIVIVAISMLYSRRDY